RRVPYPGGRLRVSGWVKTADVVRGEAPWHLAALQLISFDAGGQAVGHHDVVLLGGTTDWTRYETTVLLSGAVAAVEVHCHLWGEKTRGRAWFDDVELEFLPGPPGLLRRKLDLARAEVTVDLGRDLGEFRHLWIGSDVGWSDRVLTPTQIDAMRVARMAGFRYVRLHDMVHNPRVYHELPDGTPVYAWTGFDRRIGAVVDNGLLPVVVLEGMPPELATRDGGLDWCNPYPPRDAAAHRRWQELVRQIVAHCRERWGDGVRDWYFEVWNEPDASGYFAGTLEEYLRIYDHAVAGATAADPAIRIGGPGGAGTGWCGPLLEHCRAGRNDATGGTGARIDFLSWHLYTVGVGLPTFAVLEDNLGTVRRLLDASPAYRDLPTLITEWGCASSNSPVHDRPYDAAFRALAVRAFLDHGITLALPFCLGEGPPHAHDGFMGGLALFTKTTIPKPGFRAFELLGPMVGRRVACDSSNDPVGGLAAWSAAGRELRVLLYNLIEDYRRPAYETAVSLTVKGLPPGEWSARLTRIAPGEVDPYLAWEAMSRPETLTREQHEQLLQASALRPAEALNFSGGRAALSLPGSAVALIELRPARR
ncbi:MAG: hypothetical protein HYU66_03025, partial [Armatimonadetes bacterium]|nr:hypothetical protein [Armatimonadota bacterium]